MYRKKEKKVFDFFHSERQPTTRKVGIKPRNTFTWLITVFFFGFVRFQTKICCAVDFNQFFLFWSRILGAFSCFGFLLLLIVNGLRLPIAPMKDQFISLSIQTRFDIRLDTINLCCLSVHKKASKRHNMKTECNSAVQRLMVAYYRLWNGVAKVLETLSVVLKSFRIFFEDCFLN